MVELSAPKQILAPSYFGLCFDDCNRFMDWDDIVALVRNDQLLKNSSLKACEMLHEGAKKGCERIERYATAVALACRIAGKRTGDYVVGLGGAMVDFDYVAPDVLCSAFDGGLEGGDFASKTGGKFFWRKSFLVT